MEVFPTNNGQWRLDPVVGGSNRGARANTRLAELEHRRHELVKAWLLRVVDDLSLDEVGRLHLAATVEGLLAIYGFVLDAARAMLRPDSFAADGGRYSKLGRLARESTGDDPSGAGAIKALGWLQELLERELPSACGNAQVPRTDPVSEAIASVCERLRAAVLMEFAVQWERTPGSSGR